MALAILDGTQTATTLSTILSSGQHITAHTVVSLGTQAITDMRGAVSGSVVSVSSLPAISGTVTANVFGKESFGNTFVPIQIGASGENFTNGNRIGVSLINDAGTEYGVTGSPLSISGTVTVGNSVTIGSALPAGTNRIGVVTIGAGTVTLGAGTQRIGSVTAFGRRTNYSDGIEIPIVLTGDTGVGYGYNDNPFIPIRIITNAEGQSSDFVGSNTGGNLPISGTVTVGNSVTIGSLPALVAGTNQIGSVTASISGTVPISISSVTIGNSVTIGSLPAISGTVTANTFALQGTAVTTSNFTSTTASTALANYNATRQVLTIFNEGAGNLHIAPGATCTTIAYQVRLSAGDYYEVPNHQTTITHSAVFATAGTARICQLS